MKNDKYVEVYCGVFDKFDYDRHTKESRIYVKAGNTWYVWIGYDEKGNYRFQLCNDMGDFKPSVKLRNLLKECTNNPLVFFDPFELDSYTPIGYNPSGKDVKLLSLKRTI